MHAIENIADGADGLEFLRLHLAAGQFLKLHHQVDGIDAANRSGGVCWWMHYSRAARPAVGGAVLVGLVVAGIVVLAREPKVTRVIRGPDFA